MGFGDFQALDRLIYQEKIKPLNIQGLIISHWWCLPEPNPRPSSEQESVRKNTVLILDHLAEFVDIRPNWNIVRKRISILPSAPQSASRLALLGGLCVLTTATHPPTIRVSVVYVWIGDEDA